MFISLLLETIGKGTCTVALCVIGFKCSAVWEYGQWGALRWVCVCLVFRRSALLPADDSVRLFWGMTHF